MQQNHVSSLIFPPGKPLPEIFGTPRLRQEILQEIQEDSDTLASFSRLTPTEQNAFLNFCMGNRGLQITYDPFFREIFHPLKHPLRLGRFLSSILGQPVTIHSVLPREGTQFSGDASLMIMDILVKTADGSLINVEMQKMGYAFPIERSFCYGSDLLVRQYNTIREELKNNFSYKHLRPVYIIVLMEKSPSIFHQKSCTYIHHSKFQFDSGLSTNNLLNFIYIPLDIFLQIPHNEITELEAWLYFLSSSQPLHIQKIIEKFPFFMELYQDIINFRFHPKELISMYSEALAIADRNTIQYMIEKMEQDMVVLHASLNEKQAEISEMELAISQKESELSQMDAEISQKDAEISQKDAEISQKDAEISQKDAEISQKDAEISQKDAEISQKDAEISRLKALLEQQNN